MMNNPTIAITNTISIQLFGEIDNGGYIFWINNRPAIEVNIRNGATFINWNTEVRTEEWRLIQFISQYNTRLEAAIERGAWPRQEA